MSDILSIRTNVLSPLSSTQVSFLPDIVLTLTNGRIASLQPAAEAKAWDIDYSDQLCIPGLIDTHVHLSQYRIRGSYQSALLPWLESYVFPEEEKSQFTVFAQKLAEEFFSALIMNGTTTAVIYTAPFFNACRTAFEAARAIGYPALIGMTLMDSNAPPELQQDTRSALLDCMELINLYHRPAERLEFVLTPRFAPTCSSELMQQVAILSEQHDLRIQTHLSENTDEIQWVKELFGVNSYTEVYQKFGLLTPRSILAHCIHLSKEELDLLQSSGSNISHCPDSNFFLHSGAFPLAEIIERDIPFALGSDVGAGTTLNMLYHAKMYHYRQAVTPVNPVDAFYRITLGAASLLNLDSVTGSVETGKDADLVFLPFPFSPTDTTEDITSRLIFTGEQYPPTSVYIKGKRLL